MVERPTIEDRKDCRIGGSSMNCKVGDLAYIVVTESEVNRGAVVEVISLNPIATDLFGCPTWNVRSCRPLVNTIDVSIEGNCEDCRLRPISGVPLKDEVTDEITA
jgi:hypothetical protein